MITARISVLGFKGLDSSTLRWGCHKLLYSCGSRFAFVGEVTSPNTIVGPVDLCKFNILKL